MPYINVDGRLTEVTQEQFDIYTIGQNLNASLATVQTSAANIAAGGTVTQSDSITNTILTPNTVNTSPGQLLETTSATAIFTPSQLDAQTSSLGVAGEEGFITTDTYSGQNSLTAEELNAIADSQGVSGEEGFITSDTYNGQSSLTAEELNAIAASQGVSGEGDEPVTNSGVGTSSDSTSATANIQGLVSNAQQQQTIADQRKQINNGDWRVRLRLAPQSNYLYNAPTPGIMQPLKVTDGIIFPYTPQIDTSYKANYETYDLTHSNYRGYFYKNSYVDAISLKAQFTAQDTNDANYLLAVITFLKSATKMFYGQDTQRGAPPPLVYLSGFGDYQFREHACVISQFQYNLPDNVDYIRAGSPNNVGLNLTSIRDRQSVATNSIFGSINRLAAAFLPKGGTTGASAPPTLGLNRPTYVPTKMDINLTLLPMQSRQQVSKQFSVKEFANGNLIKGGFW